MPITGGLLAPTLEPSPDELPQLGKYWLWFVILGILLVLMGVFAISTQWVATLVSVLVFGWLLIGAGIVEIISAIMARCWKAFFLHLIMGILHIIVGMMMVDQPERTAIILTLILAVAFMIGGAARIIFVLVQRFTGWQWVLLNGVVTLALGVMIWKQFPESSLWVIGTFVGIDLIFNGWSWIMLGLAAQRVAGAVKAATNPS